MGKVKCWTENVNNAMPEEVANASNFTQVSVGNFGTCVLNQEGRIQCWSSTSDPWQNNFLENLALELEEERFIQISIGSFQLCAISESNNIKCWELSPRWVPIHSFNHEDIPGFYTQVNVGRNQFCALSSHGQLHCWKKDIRGAHFVPDDNIDAELADNEGVYTSIESHGYNYCATTSNHQVKCWGRDNGYPMVSIAESEERYQKLVMEGGAACAIDGDHEIICWYWPWGFEELVQVNAPALDANQGEYIAVNTSWLYSCGLSSEGIIKCWNSEGQEDLENIPAEFQRSYETINVGYSGFACATTTENQLVCWSGSGLNFCELGHDPEDRWDCQSDQPDTFFDDGLYTHVAVGNRFACVLTTENEVRCWRYDRLDFNSLELIQNFADAEILAQDDFYTQIASTNPSYEDEVLCALTNQGHIKCWPQFHYRIHESFPEEDENRYEQMSFSISEICGLKENGQVNCWGHQFELDGAPEFLTGFTQITRGCGIKENGQIACWGLQGGYGKLDVPDINWMEE